MNYITNAKNQNLLNVRELRLGHTGTLSSWHRQYKDSAWIFVGGLNYELTEGDIICVFSQYGEIVNINLLRDKKSGNSKGSVFLCYEDQRSTVLAVDNLNGIKLAGRIIRVDHIENYRVPKDGNIDVFDPQNGERIQNNRNDDPVYQFVKEHGCGPDVMKRLEKVQQVSREEIERRKKIIHRKNEKDSMYLKTFKIDEGSRKSSTSKRHKQDRDRNQPRLWNPSPSPPRRMRIKEEPLTPNNVRR